MEIGGLRGLTFDTGQDKLIQDLQYQDQMMQRKQAADAARTQLLLKDIDFLKGSNNYDAQIMQKRQLDLINNLGKLTSERGPGWESDINTMAQVQAMKAGLANDPAYIRSVAYQNALNDFQKWSQVAAKDPKRYNLDQLEQAKAQFANYGKDENGNPLPEEMVKPMMFNPPNEIPNFEEIHMKNGNSIKMDKFDTMNNGRDGAYIGYASDETIANKAKDLYNQYESEYNYVYKGMSPEQIVGQISSSLKPHTPHEYKIGERDPVKTALAIEQGKLRLRQAFEKNENAKNPKSLYDVSFFNQDSGFYGDQILSDVFTRTPPAQYTDAKGNKIDIVGEDVTYDGDFYDTGFAKNKQRNHIYRMPVKLRKSIDWAKSQGFVEDPFGPSGAVEGTDLEVKKSLKDRGQIILVDLPNGKKAPMFELNAEAVVDGREAVYKNRMDKGMSAKIRSMVGVEPEDGQMQSASPEEAPVGAIITDNRTGKRYRKVSGGYEEL